MLFHTRSCSPRSYKKIHINFPLSLSFIGVVLLLRDLILIKKTSPIVLFRRIRYEFINVFQYQRRFQIKGKHLPETRKTKM